MPRRRIPSALSRLWARSSTVRAYSAACRRLSWQCAGGVVPPIGEAFGVAGELPCRPEQARVDEVEDRPQVAEAVLDRCPGQRDPGPRLQRLGRAGLLGARVLDRLRLVQDC